MTRRVYIGTDELVGATITSVDWNDMTLEKDGRKLFLSLEYEEDYHSMCEGNCCSHSSTAYFRAEEVK
jgi:queuine/archaeosine tRNA-ribosyltransferase